MTGRRTSAKRVLSVLFATAAPALLAACGGHSAPSGSPVGSPQNPAVGREFPGPAEATNVAPSGRRGADKPGYADIVKSQKRSPRQRFTPCNLVTKAQAQAILRAPILAPHEAPQGPTCIYRGRAKATFVTLAVQSAAISGLRRRLRDVQRLKIASRRAYCGNLGQSVLYVGLGTGRVLTVVAPCRVAKRFASTALSRLRA